MVLWQAREAPTDGERSRRPLDDPPRLSIFASGKFDEEVAVEFVGSCPRGGAEVAGGLIRRSAAQRPLLFRELHREHEARLWSNSPFAVGRCLHQCLHNSRERRITAVRDRETVSASILGEGENIYDALRSMTSG